MHFLQAAGDRRTDVSIRGMPSISFLRTERLREFVRGREILATVVLVALLVLAAGAMWWLAASPIPDFREFEAGDERKLAFFEFMRPLIEEENARIMEDRQRLQELAAEESPGWLDRRWLHGLAHEYGVDAEDLDDETLIAALLRRVDVVPLSLALAQAAKESGWGTSRFARKGYNLFGEWCYDPGCGLVPRARARDRSHEVRVFDSPRDSVASYLRNINTHPGYRALRRVRAGMRAEDRPLSGMVLAEQLQRYSERGQAYVEDIKGLIRHNELEQAGA